MKFYISIITAFLVTLASCDFFGTYNYVIENRWQEPILVTLTSKDFDSIRGKVFKVYPNDTVLVLTSGTENLGRDEQPRGVYIDELFPIVEIEIADTLNNVIAKDFRKSRYWRYSVTGNREGTYRLVVDSVFF